MGWFSGDKKDSGEDTVKRAKQKKKTLAIDQQIADLQIAKAKAQGKGDGGGDDFWSTWASSDWDW